MTVLERETEIRGEWNHSCTSQCPNPCPASSMLEGDTEPRMQQTV